MMLIKNLGRHSSPLLPTSHWQPLQVDSTSRAPDLHFATSDVPPSDAITAMVGATATQKLVQEDASMLKEPRNQAYIVSTTFFLVI
jgi:hypothetical protein